jgi:hypothetical protein
MVDILVLSAVGITPAANNAPTVPPPTAKTLPIVIKEMPKLR